MSLPEFKVEQCFPHELLASHVRTMTARSMTQPIRACDAFCLLVGAPSTASAADVSFANDIM
jgi:hypothetical protein